MLWASRQGPRPPVPPTGLFLNLPLGSGQSQEGTFQKDLSPPTMREHVLCPCPWKHRRLLTASDAVSPLPDQQSGHSRCDEKDKQGEALPTLPWGAKTPSRGGI